MPLSGLKALWFFSCVLLAGLTVSPARIEAQAQTPSEDAVKAQQAAYQQERDFLLKTGAGRRFLPILMKKAEEFAKRAEAALKSGRLLQAAELYGEARWQLPYQSTQVPDHVERILGNLRLRHGQEINDVAFSPDGTILATASKDRTVKLWDMGNGHEILTYYGHRDHVRSLEFTPDGKMIASAGGDKDIRLWDPQTGKDIRVIKGKGVYVTALAISPDGKTVVVGNDDRAVRMYDIASGKLQREITDFRQRVEAVAFNKDGSVLATGDADGTMRLYAFPSAMKNKNEPAYWAKQDFTGACYDVAFNPDGKLLAYCGPEGIKLYNTPTRNAAVVITQHHTFIKAPDGNSRFSCLTFSKDGKTIFTGGMDSVIRLWDTSAGQPLGTFKGHNGPIRAIEFNKSGTTLASASADYTVRLWQFDVVVQARSFTGHDGSVWKSSFSPNGARVVSASADRTVRVWDAVTGETLLTLEGHELPVTVAKFSPDGKLIASAGGDRVIRLWDAKSGKPVRQLEGHSGTITDLAFDQNGSRIISCGADRDIKVWETATGKELYSCGDSDSIVTSVAFSPDGNQFASSHVDQSIRLWDAATGKLKRRWVGHALSVSDLSFSPDGKYLASCGGDKVARVWPMSDPGRNPITLSGHSGPVSSVVFRPDNTHLVTAGSDLLVKLWKLHQGKAKLARDYRGHTDWITSVDFSSDGYYIASSGVDRTIKIWEITSREIPLSSEHTGSVLAVAVSPDGKTVASGATDRSIKFWDLDSGVERLSIPNAHEEDIRSLSFSPDGRILVSSGNDRDIKLWDTSNGKALPKKKYGHLLKGLINPVPEVTVTSDGKRLLAWVLGNERYTSVMAFAIDDAEQKVTFNDQGRHVLDVRFSDDGTLSAFGAKDGTVRLYKIGDNNAERLVKDDGWKLFDDEKGVTALDLSADKKILVAGSDKGEVKVCAIDGRKVLRSFQAHPRGIVMLVVSPDGKTIATFGKDNVVKLWDLAKGTQLRQWDMKMLIQERGGFVADLAFTPDSKRLLTANANSTVYVLDLP